MKTAFCDFGGVASPCVFFFVFGEGWYLLLLRGITDCGAMVRLIPVA